MAENKALTWREFFETEAPGGAAVIISDAAHRESPSHSYSLRPVPLQLWCESEECEGNHWFDFKKSTSGKFWSSDTEDEEVIVFRYCCRHCRKQLKFFGVFCCYSGASVVMIKIGELPPFGPPLPKRLLDLADSDRSLLLKGRRCENQGLGIGAFTYYRRVVENQRNRLLDAVRRTAVTVGGFDDLIADIDLAKSETQFQKSIDTIKHALPQSLLLNGQNPLTLLHNALSGGVHNKTDQECLHLATSVRTLLTALMDRVSMAVSEDASLKTAIGLLAASRQKAEQSGSPAKPSKPPSPQSSSSAVAGPGSRDGRAGLA